MSHMQAHTTKLVQLMPTDPKRLQPGFIIHSTTQPGISYKILGALLTSDLPRQMINHEGKTIDIIPETSMYLARILHVNGSNQTEFNQSLNVAITTNGAHAVQDESNLTVLKIFSTATEVQALYPRETACL